jgi:hypothetical protein
MRHQRNNVPAFVAEAGNAKHRTVGIGLGRHSTRWIAVTKHDLAIPVQPIDDVRWREVIAITVRDGQSQDLSSPTG